MEERQGVDSGAQPTVESAGAEAQRLLGEVFKNLRGTASEKGEAVPSPADKFFPNGVELIYVKVEAGLTEKTKVSVELKIAGEKGVKDRASEATEGPGSSVGDGEV
jgi:hypothetical protein